MKKIICLVIMILGVCTMVKETPAEEKIETEVVLPQPDYQSGRPLMQTLQDRRTYREFGPRIINDQNLAELLWAANGVNRPDGRRTIPTARDSRDLDIYVLKQGGAYRYNPDRHMLELVNPAALRYTAAKQDFVKQADVLLVYVSNNQNKEYAAMHAGSAYQNVGLYCASVGLNNVVLGMIDRNMLHKELHLNEDDYVIIAQALGWPKKK